MVKLWFSLNFLCVFIFHEILKYIDIKKIKSRNITKMDKKGEYIPMVYVFQTFGN